MVRYMYFLIAIFILVTLSPLATVFGKEKLPNTIIQDPSVLAKLKDLVNKKNDPNVQNFLENLISQSNVILTKKVTSVMDKHELPPSGDKHDFYSLAAYEWPNPNTTSGLPYVSRDGKINPEIYTIPDKVNLEKLVERVNILAVANYLTQNTTYSLKAQELLRVWFLDKDTLMNPNLNYAEIEKGKGRLNPSGIMEGVYLPGLVDAIALLKQSPDWSKEIEDGMQVWFSNYLNWLINSTSGKTEGKRMNNHGTYYNMQVASIALYLNRSDFTKELLQSMTQDVSSAPLDEVSKLIAVRINPDGSQPFEAVRTTSLHYHMYNLLGLFHLASIGERVGIDLWNYKVHGVGLRKALDFMMPYALNQAQWPFQQIGPIYKDELAQLSCEAILHYGNNPSYIAAYKSINSETLRINPNYPLCNSIVYR